MVDQREVCVLFSFTFIMSFGRNVASTSNHKTFGSLFHNCLLRLSLLLSLWNQFCLRESQGPLS